ncbi:MarR family winged helix-turn-helix transcriptional regulator [Catenulispora pinisilvae]|uniref:MarR family winged helix-turn-helix transcriptional regulator n=1 Tax=Catenulispora pinisilvae TaxID=2705253 RepID=UPI0018925887|nr:MarR family transcriptional regulator [Catenulispora pinisilvae]
MTDDPLAPEGLALRLADVYLLVGPLYRRVLRKVETSQEIEGVGAGVRMVLDLLRQGGPMTVPQMGRAQALSRQFVQRMVNDAAERGFVEAVPNPAHRRSSLIRLTEAGRTVIEAVIAREHGLLGQVGGDLTQADVDACVKVLSCMLDELSDVDVD